MTATQYVLNPKNADEVLTNVYDPVTNSIGGGSTPPPSAMSYIRMTGGLSISGSYVLIYNTTAESSGTDITYVPSAGNGDSFLINTSGIYSISNVCHHESGGSIGCINVASFPVAPSTIDSSTRGYFMTPVIGGVRIGTLSWTGYIAAGQSVFASLFDNPSGSSDDNQITVARVA